MKKGAIKGRRAEHTEIVWAQGTIVRNGGVSGSRNNLCVVGVGLRFGQEAYMISAVLECCAGIDVGKKWIAVCVLKGPAMGTRRPKSASIQPRISA
jgi:hypothetical protein